jgi:hypothetical protein
VRRAQSDLGEERGLASQTLLLSYLFLVLLQTLHTFEEIACDVFEMSVGHVTVERNRYLLMASVLSTVTVLPLALLIYDLSLGYYLGLFTSAVIGALQGVVHAVGYARSGTVRGSLGAGFYTAIPLSITGVVVFVQLVLALSG